MKVVEIESLDQLGQFGAEQCLDVMAASVAGAALVGVGLDDHRMAPMGFLDDVLAEPLRVVRTDQPERELRIDRDIQQGLMQLTLEEFFGASTGPDRLADASHRLAIPGVAVQELLPGGDDARWVAAQLAHVDESDFGGRASRRAHSATTPCAPGSPLP